MYVIYGACDRIERLCENGQRALSLQHQGYGRASGEVFLLWRQASPTNISALWWVYGALWGPQVFQGYGKAHMWFDIAYHKWWLKAYSTKVIWKCEKRDIKSASILYVEYDE